MRQSRRRRRPTRRTIPVCARLPPGPDEAGGSPPSPSHCPARPGGRGRARQIAPPFVAGRGRDHDRVRDAERAAAARHRRALASPPRRASRSTRADGAGGLAGEGDRLDGDLVRRPPRGARTTRSLPLRITARVRAGTHAFAATQRYDDGATVNWNADLSVLPAAGAAAPKQHPWGALAAAVAGVAVIGGSVFVLRRARQELHFKIDSGTGCYGRIRDLPPVPERGPRLCLLSRRRRGSGHRGDRRPAVRDRAPRSRRPGDVTSASSARSRRTRTPTMCRGTAGSHSSTASP